MPEPSFTRPDASDPLFTLAVTGTPPGYTIAFLPTAATSATTLTLSQTWSATPGIYLFLGSAPADHAVLAAAVIAFTGSRATRFLWIDNPNAATSAWLTSEIDVTGTITPTAQLLFRNFIVSIGSGSTIALTGGNDGFTIAAVGDAKISLLTKSGASSLPAGNTASIPFTGALAGTVAFAVSIDGETSFAQLDACCRYFVDDTDFPVPGMLKALTYPVLDAGALALTLYASVDPVNPLVPSRSFFNFLQTPSSSAAAIPSGFRTVYGQTMSLTPSASPAYPAGPSLVFAVSPSRTTPSPSDPYYTTFHGPFSLALATSDESSDTSRMMFGFSAVEYVGLSASAANQLVFTSGQPSYAPPVRPAGTAADDSPPLTSLGTTAWGFVTTGSATPLSYFAQPQESALYQATPESGSDSDEDFLYFLEIFAGTFPPYAAPASNTATELHRGDLDTPPTVVPMVPYALIDPAIAGVVADLERQVLSRYRRNILARLLAPTETGPKTGSRAAATPQGLLLGLDQELRYWELLTLAQLDGGVQKLQLANVTGAFKSALQSNQLFAVVSNYQEFLRNASTVGTFSLRIDGWTFALDPSLWAQHRTMMLIKYGDQSVWDLSADPANWNWRAAADGYSDTSGNLPTTQADLRKFLAEAIAAATVRPELAGFASAVRNPLWNGILFLRAPLPTTNFPPELAGLSAGIDPNRLFAHHVGLNLTPVHNIGGALTQEDTSVFALIDYQDPVDLTDTGVAYDYKVLGLTVGFQNSAQSSFSSTIELLINALFGSVTTRTELGAIKQLTGGTTHGNNILLTGQYQKQNGTASYVFLMENETAVYRVVNPVLEQVDITRAQFVTLSPAGAATVETRFILEGDLLFTRLGDFDVFAFGPRRDEEETIVEEGHLHYRNLLVEMTFPAATPAEKTFVFNAGTIAFDLSQSTARGGSLYTHFPLLLGGLLQGSSDTSPGDYGYMSVTSALPQTPRLPAPWYALLFDFNLGTAGALASNAGIVVRLMAAWSSTNQQRALTYVGMLLPGSSGTQTELSLQGVLKLTFRGIDFSAAPSAQGVDYILRFRGIELRLLSISFPPGYVDLAIFGDPSGGSSGTIGWYTAYLKKTDDEEETASAAGMLTIPRRQRHLLTPPEVQR
jgi:hypothetical protein